MNLKADPDAGRHNLPPPVGLSGPAPAAITRAISLLLLTPGVLPCGRTLHT